MLWLWRLPWEQEGCSWIHPDCQVLNRKGKSTLINHVLKTPDTFRPIPVHCTSLLTFESSQMLVLPNVIHTLSEWFHLYCLVGKRHTRVSGRANIYLAPWVCPVHYKHWVWFLLESASVSISRFLSQGLLVWWTDTPLHRFSNKNSIVYSSWSAVFSWHWNRL